MLTQFLTNTTTFLQPFIQLQSFQWFIILVTTLLAMIFIITHTKKKKHNKTQQFPLPTTFTDPTLDPSFTNHSWILVPSKKQSSDDNAAEDSFQWQYDVKNQSPIPWPTFTRESNPNASDLIFRQQLQKLYPDNNNTSTTNTTSTSCSQKTLLHYAFLSQHHGCVPNDYGGPMFLLPGLIIALYISRQEQSRELLVLLSTPYRAAMAKYIINHQQPDGGWGTHIAGTSTNFCSTLNYVALRLLGVPPTHPSSVKARLFFTARQQGAAGAPLWSKVWLAILGVYDWRGVPPVPPELWLLPTWFPFHLGNTWCHARQVALPMSYLYGKKFVYPLAEQDVVVQQLRKELYPEQHVFSYHDINWSKICNQLDPADTYGSKPSLLLKCGNQLLKSIVEPLFMNSWLLRTKALEETSRLIIAEDEQNGFLCIGPVNKALNLVCALARNDIKALDQHIKTSSQYLWVSEDGMKMQGYTNSMVWDASFALLAVHEILEDLPEQQQQQQQLLQQFAQETCEFIVRNQQTSNTPNYTKNYRDPCKGGWGFGTKQNTYIVSDCTAEALRAVIKATSSTSTVIEKYVQPIENAVDLILWMQNDDDGAWASYEKRRGYSWYELLNPALVFSDIMIDYSYLECTSSCVQALVAYCESPYGKTSPTRVELAKTAVLERALPWILKQQREDGSWFGQWGVCFTYASYFACEALACVLPMLNNTHNEKTSSRELIQTIHSSLQRTMDYLIQVQNITPGNGVATADAAAGWGESIDSCLLKQYVTSTSTVVHTSWAILSITSALQAMSTTKEDQPPLYLNRLQLAYNYLKSCQDSQTGDFPIQQGMYGVFNKTCGVTYTSYRHIFTGWALHRCEKLLLNNNNKKKKKKGE
jgi:cycloartenol synthase